MSETGQPGYFTGVVLGLKGKKAGKPGGMNNWMVKEVQGGEGGAAAHLTVRCRAAREPCREATMRCRAAREPCREATMRCRDVRSLCREAATGTAGHSSGAMNYDWINALPDDILIKILSLITVSEAAMTGFLSTRWRHLWKNVDHLTLDAHTFGMQEIEKSCYHENPVLWNVVATKFVHKVNGLLQNLYGKKIQEFTIRFPLTSTHASELDCWIAFAVATSTEKIYLDLVNKCCKASCAVCVKGIMESASEPYDLPLGPFSDGRSCLLNKLIISNCSLGTVPTNLSDFSRIKYLILSHVLVTDATISNIMSSCCALESLGLQCCNQLIHLTTSHAQLQNLNVRFCKSLLSVCIRADGLESFTYKGHKVNIEYKHAPCLDTLHVYFVKYECPLDFLSAFPKLPKLEILVLQFPTLLQVYRVLKHASRFTGLTSVTLVLMKPWEDDICSMAYLLKAAPLVEYFVLHGCCKLQQQTQLNIRWPEDFKLARLYTIMVSGFSGEFELMELMYFLLRSTPALDLFQIDTRFMEPWFFKSNKDKSQDGMRRRYAREMASAHLAPKVPSTVEFNIT